MSGCTYAKVVAREWGGGWSFEADRDLFLMIQPDGQYTISFEAAHAPEPVEWPGGMTTTTTPAGEHSEGCEGYGTDTVDGPIPTLWDVATPPDMNILTGQLDPANPGTTVSGTTTLDDPLNSSTTTVEWKLTHDGPIQLGLP